MNTLRETNERLTTGAALRVFCRAVPYADAPVDDGPWDADAAIKRLREWAGVDAEKPTAAAWRKYATAFALVDGPDDALGSYKLPHHDIRNGRFVVVKRGVYAAAAALQGARGGVSAPAAEIAAAKRHIAQHYRQWDERAPWESSRAATRLPGVLIAEIPPTITDEAARPRSWIQAAIVGEWKGHPAGEFEFTPEVFDEIVRNFKATENRHLPLDFEHGTEKENEDLYRSGAPATGWIVELENRGAAGLWALVEWLEPGLSYVRAGRYRYFSPAITFDATDPVSGEKIGALMTSGALTNRPFLDGMMPVAARVPRAIDTSAAQSATLAAQPAQTGTERKRMDPEKLLLEAREDMKRVRLESEAAVTEARKATAEAGAEAKRFEDEAKRYRAVISRIAKAMGMDDSADPDDVAKHMVTTIEEAKRMKGEEAKRAEAEAEGEAKRLESEGRIAESAEARAAVAKLYLSDRKTFDVLYPKRADNDARLLSQRVVNPRDGGPPRRENTPPSDGDPHADAAHQLALEYQRADVNLSYREALGKASSAIRNSARS